MSTETVAAGFGGALDRVEGVEGWMTDAQARRLWDAARRIGSPGRVVEIGSFRGRSAIILACAAEEGVEIIAIDPHGGGDRGPREISPDAVRGQADHRLFHANLERAGVSERVRHLRATSQAALDQVAGGVDLLYVDGAHRYSPARADIEHWGERVAPGGTMLIHDCFNAVGVTLAQIRVLFGSRHWRYVARSGSLAEYERTQMGGLDVAANVLRQLSQLPSFVRLATVKLLLVTRLAPLTRLLGHESTDWPY
jgi:predicted O-methyltransferase YrrM